MASADENKPSGPHEYFTAHPERTFLLKVLAAFIAVYTLLAVTNDRQLKILAAAFAILAPLYFAASAVAKSESLGEVVRKHLSFIPRLRLDGNRRKAGIAWVTYALIATNVAIHYSFTEVALTHVEGVIERLAFLPMNPGLLNTPVSLFTSMFLHGSSAHLWVNMLFLWGIGTAVEKRVGRMDYIAFYIITGIFAAAFQAVVLLSFFDRTIHGLGASGAIAGVMGVYMVRCSFMHPTYHFPGFLPVNLKVRVNAVALFALFFFMDLSGVIDEVPGGLTRFGSWAHLGGMFGGFVIALRRGLAVEAVTEKNLEAGLVSLDEGIGLGEGEQSLRAALESDPGNLAAMLALARMKSKERHSRSPEARQLYEKVIGLFANQDPRSAAEVYQEYRDKYEQGLDPQFHYRIAGALHFCGEYDSAARSYEELADREDAPAETREKALYRCARILDEMGLEEGAEMFYRRFLERFPGSAMVKKVRKRVGGGGGT